MAELGVDAVLLSVGPDLPYLTGYEAMPLERLTMLVLPVDGDATLVVPRLEAPRVTERPEVFAVRAWDETDDPIAIVAGLVGAGGTLAIGDRTWARFLVDLQNALPAARFTRGSEVVGPLRARKDPAEVEAGRAVQALPHLGVDEDLAGAGQGAQAVAGVGRAESDPQRSGRLGRPVVGLDALLHVDRAGGGLGRRGEVDPQRVAVAAGLRGAERPVATTCTQISVSWRSRAPGGAAERPAHRWIVASLSLLPRRGSPPSPPCSVAGRPTPAS